jgi:ADP-heptose:LPS heptosyltransferase
MKSLKIYIINFLLFFQNTLLNIFFSIIFFNLSDNKNKEKIFSICIFRNGNIGDMTCSLPSFYRIKKNYPNSKIYLLSSAGEFENYNINSVLKNLVWIEDIIPFETILLKEYKYLKKIVNIIKSKKIDLFIELPNEQLTFLQSIRNIIFARLITNNSFFTQMINYVKFFKQSQSSSSLFTDEVTRLNNILTINKFDYNDIEYPALFDNNYLKKNFKLTNLNYDKIISVSPGAKRSMNIWPTDNYIEVIKHLLSEQSLIILIGSKNDKSICDYIEKNCKSKYVINLSGKTNILDVFSIIKNSNFTISNDTGTQHISSAVGTKVISIFSARDINGKWHPYDSKYIFRSWPNCHTCYLEKCYNDNLCLKLINPQIIINAVNNLLNEKI